MKDFADLYARLDATTRTNPKVAALADYFASDHVPPEDKLWTVALFSGRRPRRRRPRGRRHDDEEAHEEEDVFQEDVAQEDDDEEEGHVISGPAPRAGRRAAFRAACPRSRPIELIRSDRPDRRFDR